MKKIVFISGKDPIMKPVGGHDFYVRSFALAAQRAGFEPHLFCVTPEDGIEETFFGIIHRVKSRVRPFRQMLVAGHAWPLASAVVAFLEKQEGPQLIHGFGAWGFAGTLAERKLRKKGHSVVTLLSSYTIYEDEVRSNREGCGSQYSLGNRLRFWTQHLWVKMSVQPLERITYRQARLVLVNYASVQKMAQDRFGSNVRFRKIKYTDENAFTSVSQTREENGNSSSPWKAGQAFRIISLSHHNPRKGVDILIRALARLRDEGIDFQACLLAGGYIIEEHRRLVRILELGDKVQIPGFVPDASIYLKEADIFVLPSRREQSGSLALIEALRAELPAVVSACDGIPEDVVDGESALLVPPGDEVALAAALKRLLADKELRQRLGQGARITFENRFSPEAFVADLRQVYAELGFKAEE